MKGRHHGSSEFGLLRKAMTEISLPQVDGGLVYRVTVRGPGKFALRDLATKDLMRSIALPSWQEDPGYQ